MGWHSFTVGSSSEAEEVAEQVLRIANDPRTWSLSTLGATVIWQKLEGKDRFFVSAFAVAIFQGLIGLHRGGPSNPPPTFTLKASRASRLLLGFKTAWDPFKASSPERRSPDGGGDRRHAGERNGSASMDSRRM